MRIVNVVFACERALYEAAHHANDIHTGRVLLPAAASLARVLMSPAANIIVFARLCVIARTTLLWVAHTWRASELFQVVYSAVQRNIS